ncbi:MAG: MgtC/SapB family protein [Oscillospiraceae bacterium]|nr:MgtC/SapB family protein [Oscillospiraceae bacterium]
MLDYLREFNFVSIAHQQVSGLTTAIGLFSSAMLGLACGTGFYEAVIPAVVIIILALELMHPLEGKYKRRLRNIDIVQALKR